jgi:hypothetical protein
MALFVLSAAVFNIERLDFANRQDIINLDSFLYVLISIFVISVIAYPWFSRYSVYIPLALGLGAYLLCKTVFFGQHPLWGGMYTYISVTEMTFVGILISLAHHLARRLCEFEQSVENMMLQDFERRVQTLDGAAEEVKNYMLFSRRYKRPLSVVVVEPEPDTVRFAMNSIIKDLQRAMINRYVIAKIGSTIGSAIRRTDLLIVQPERNRYIILCPETDDEEIDVLTERIQAATDRRIGISIKYGKALFPHEGLTLDDLLGKAESNLDSRASVKDSLVESELEGKLQTYKRVEGARADG